MLDIAHYSGNSYHMETAALVKIKSYRIRQSGRGLTITLPSIWTDDLSLSPKDRLDVFRDTEDRLILVAKKEALDGNPRADD